MHSSEPLLGAASEAVIIDLMSCKRCGTDIPAVRGKRRYALLSREKLSQLGKEMQEARSVDAQMQERLAAMEERSHALDREIERCRTEGEISALEERVSALERENRGLEEKRAQLAETLEYLTNRLPAPSR